MKNRRKRAFEVFVCGRAGERREIIAREEPRSVRAFSRRGNVQRLAEARVQRLAQFGELRPQFGARLQHVLVVRDVLGVPERVRVCEVAARSPENLNAHVRRGRDCRRDIRGVKADIIVIARGDGLIGRSRLKDNGCEDEEDEEADP